MSKLKKLAGETVIYGLSSILPRVINYFVITVYLTHKFEQATFGLFSELFSYVGLVLVFVTFRMETAYFRFNQAEKDEKLVFSTASFTVLLFTIIGLGLILMFRSSLSIALFEVPDLELVIVVLAAIIFFDATEAVPFAKLRHENRPLKFAMYKIIKVTAVASLTLLFIEQGAFMQGLLGWDIFTSTRVQDRILVVVLANLVGSLLSFGLLFQYYLAAFTIPDVHLWKRMLWYASPLAVVAASGVFNQYFGINLVKIYVGQGLEGSAESGLYSATLRIAILMTLFITAFNYAVEPFFFKNMSDEQAPFLYARVANVFTFVGCIIMLGILMNIDLVQYILGKDFREGLGILPILLLANLLLGIYFNFAVWYKIKDKTYFGALISIVGSIIMMIISMYQIPLIGRMGAAYAQLGCYAGMLTLCYFMGQYYYAIPYPIGKIIYKVLTTLLIGWFCKQTIVDAYFDGLASRLLIGNALIILFIGLVLRAEPQLIGRLPMFRKNKNSTE